MLDISFFPGPLCQLISQALDSSTVRDSAVRASLAAWHKDVKRRGNAVMDAIGLQLEHFRIANSIKFHFTLSLSASIDLKMDKVMGENILSLPILNNPHFDIILLQSSPFRPPWVTPTAHSSFCQKLNLGGEWIKSYTATASAGRSRVHFQVPCTETACYMWKLSDDAR